MTDVVKSFWSTFSMIVLVFFGIWILGVYVKPVVIATVIAAVLTFWKFTNIWNGIKYYWNLLWNWILKKLKKN